MWSRHRGHIENWVPLTQLERTADSIRKQASLKGPSYFLREAYCSMSCTCQWWHSSKTQLQYQSHRCVDPARWLQNNHESLDGKNQRLMHVKTVQTPHLAHHHPVVRYQASPIPPEPFELTSLIRERCTMASGTGSSSIHIFNTQTLQTYAAWVPVQNLQDLFGCLSAHRHQNITTQKQVKPSGLHLVIASCLKRASFLWEVLVSAGEPRKPIDLDSATDDVACIPAVKSITPLMVASVPLTNGD